MPFETHLIQFTYGPVILWNCCHSLITYNVYDTTMIIISSIVHCDAVSNEHKLSLGFRLAFKHKRCTFSKR